MSNDNTVNIELLAVCKAFESLFTRYLVVGKAQHEAGALVEQARDVIAKAEGSQR